MSIVHEHNDVLHVIGTSGLGFRKLALHKTKNGFDGAEMRRVSGEEDEVNAVAVREVAIKRYIAGFMTSCVVQHQNFILVLDL